MKRSLASLTATAALVALTAMPGAAARPTTVVTASTCVVKGAIGSPVDGSFTVQSVELTGDWTGQRTRTVVEAYAWFKVNDGTNWSGVEAHNLGFSGTSRTTGDISDTVNLTMSEDHHPLTSMKVVLGITDGRSGRVSAEISCTMPS